MLILDAYVYRLLLGKVMNKVGERPRTYASTSLLTNIDHGDKNNEERKNKRREKNNPHPQHQVVRRASLALPMSTMSDPVQEVERLRRLLEVEKARADAEKARADALGRNTTLEEFLYNCHFHLYTKFRLADESKLSTGFTNVTGRYYPKWLRPWTSFSTTERQLHFDVVRETCGQRQIFNRETTIIDNGKSISLSEAANENAVNRFEPLAVEIPVMDILRQVQGEETLREEYRFIDLKFDEGSVHFHSVDAVSGETVTRRGRPGGVGRRTRIGGDTNVAFVFDYKAAHKITVGHVRQAVARETLFMEVVRRINSSKTSSDEMQTQEKAEIGIAMALVQVFDYMVCSGVTYGYVAAGESLMLLHIDRTDLQTLYCHLCLPKDDVGEPSAVGDWANKMQYTAVAQLASFCLLSLQSEMLDGASLSASLETAEKTLERWSAPYEDAAHILDAEDTDSQSPDSSSHRADGSNYESDGSPAREITTRSKSSCRPETMPHGEDDKDDDDEAEPGGGLPRSRGRTNMNKRKERPSSGSSGNSGSQMGGSGPTRSYCTQACLLGLKRGWDLDPNCPNVSSHRRDTSSTGTRHAIDADEFGRLVGDQLRRDPYGHCKSLLGWGKKGRMGVLFKLELASYGYTLVGKGTLPEAAHLLEHESRVYSRLENLQGEVVPVHLGLVWLDKGYVLPGLRFVTCMLLLSWGGEPATEKDSTDLAAEARRSQKAVRDGGVDHDDYHGNNLLWNNERRRVMVIDFDRARFLTRPKHKRLAELTEKKRKKKKRHERGFEANAAEISS